MHYKNIYIYIIVSNYILNIYIQYVNYVVYLLFKIFIIFSVHYMKIYYMMIIYIINVNLRLRHLLQDNNLYNKC